MADLKTYQISGALAYDVTPNVKVYGGLRAQLLEAKAAISFVHDYSVDAEDKWGYGYLVGAAYELPEIALRVALTYFSKITYDLDTDREFVTSTGTEPDTETDVDTPQSVQLDFQTGVAPKTLVFGYVRWVDWSEFSISPPVYEQATIEQLLGQPRPLVDYADDWWTYNLGVGRQLTDALAGSLSITWEPERRRRDDLARPLRRPHHRHGGADLRLRPVELHRRPHLRRARRHREPPRRPTTTTARSGAPASGSATPSEPQRR